MHLQMFLILIGICNKGTTILYAKIINWFWSGGENVVFPVRRKFQLHHRTQYLYLLLFLKAFNLIKNELLAK